jgi:outer membrane protein OmpA-like peptidoglycan-associated protein
MSRLLLTAAVLAVLVYTMVLGVRWLSPRIEQDIAGRVTTSLAEQGLLWADVDVKGRDVVMSGIAPDAEAKEKALNVASHVFGVARVTDELSVAGDASATAAVAKAVAVELSADDELVKEAKAAGIYTLTITKNGDDVVLEGSVPDQASKDVLVRLADTHYGSSNVHTDGLTIVRGAPAGWRTAAGAVLIHITNLEHAKVMISGTEVMVSGSVQDSSFSDKMEKAVTDVLPKPYKAAFAVEVVTPTAEVEPAAGEENSAVTCATLDEVKKERLTFGFDKAEVGAAQQPVVERVAGKLAGCTEKHLVVAGFTDTTGSPLYNKWLSQQRAEAGLRALMREGVAKERLRAVGYGENYPAASNKTRAGRALNRRAEFSPGNELPHPVVHVRKGGKSAPAARVMKKAVKAEKSAAKTVNGVSATLPLKIVSETAIKKPWWAAKGDKPVKLPADATQQNRKLEQDLDNMVQPLPKPVKQPELGAGATEKPWLGEQN